MLKIRFKQSGGFAPLWRGCELDTAMMLPDEVVQLEYLLSLAGLSKAVSMKTPGACDVLLYHIELEDDKGSLIALSFDQIALPAKIRPLVDFLLEKSQPLCP